MFLLSESEPYNPFRTLKGLDSYFIHSLALLEPLSVLPLSVLFLHFLVLVNLELSKCQAWFSLDL